MTEIELLQQADYLLELALFKTNNFDDAEDIVQETLIAGFNAVKSKIEVQNPKAFLSGILNHKVADKLRQKYSRPVSFYGILPDFQNLQSAEKSPVQIIVEAEDKEKIRQCIVRLSKIYRDVLVMHFIHGKSVKQIADELQIGENTVKSRLNSARQNVKQRMEKLEMEKLEKQSYEPEKLDLWVFGEVDEKNPFDVSDDKHLIHQNIMLLAYEKPVTISELSDALGISAAFIEPIIKELVEDDFMKKTGDRFYSDFVIYTSSEIQKIADNDKAVARKYYKEIWTDMENCFEEIKAQVFFKEFSERQKEILLHYAAIYILHETERRVKVKKTANLDVMNLHHKSGWTGYAYGKKRSENVKIDWTEDGYSLFGLNGCHGVWTENYKNLKSLMFLGYEVNSGQTFGKFWPISDLDMLKIFYALYTKEESDIPVISQKFFDSDVIDKLCEANILTKTPVIKTADKKETSEILFNLPVLKDESYKWWNDFLKRKISFLSEKYVEKLSALFTKPLNIPKHLKNIPEQMRYQENGTYFPMAVIFYAQWNGLYLAGRDFQKNPIPAMIICVDK